MSRTTATPDLAAFLARTWETNADEVRELSEDKEGWPYAVAIAASVYRAAPGRPKKNVPHGTISPDATGKVSAREFARRANWSPNKVLRALDKWDYAAAQEIVLPSDKLTPDMVRSVPLPEVPWSSIKLPTPPSAPEADREPTPAPNPEPAPAPAPAPAPTVPVPDPTPTPTPAAADIPLVFSDEETVTPFVPPTTTATSSKGMHFIPVTTSTTLDGKLQRLSQALDEVLEVIKPLTTDEWATIGATPTWETAAEYLYQFNVYASRVDAAAEAAR